MTRWTDEQIKKIGDGHFAQHVVAMRTKDRLVWSRPHSSNSRVHYHIHGNLLTVWGDLGFAMYAWSQEISWVFLAGLNLDYFAGKCEASEVGRGFETWVEEEAKQHLTALCVNWRDEVEEGDPDPPPLRMVKEDGGFEALSTSEEWTSWVMGSAERSREFWEFGDLGMAVHARCALHLEGLKRCQKAVDEEITRHDVPDEVA